MGPDHRKSRCAGKARSLPLKPPASTYYPGTSRSVSAGLDLQKGEGIENRNVDASITRNDHGQAMVQGRDGAIWQSLESMAGLCLTGVARIRDGQHTQIFHGTCFRVMTDQVMKIRTSKAGLVVNADDGIDPTIRADTDRATRVGILSFYALAESRRGHRMAHIPREVDTKNAQVVKQLEIGCLAAWRLLARRRRR